METRFRIARQQEGNIKVLKQSGEWIDKVRDGGRKAMLPGKRISKTGKVYWETRKNRTDAPMRKI